jgi:hypothetical protein
MGWHARAARAVGAALAAASGCLALGLATAHASTLNRFTVSPTTVSRGQKVKLAGSGWTLIEYCRPTVTLTLERALPLKPLLIATVKLGVGVATAGTFTVTWTVPRSVHSGQRTLVATRRCESGKTGATVLITRSATLTVR